MRIKSSELKPRGPNQAINRRLRESRFVQKRDKKNATGRISTTTMANSKVVPLSTSSPCQIRELPNKITVAELAKQLNLEVVLFRAYTMPISAMAVDPEGYYVATDEALIAALREEAVAYLEKKTEAMKKLGVEKVSYVAEYGLAADEIISLARKTPDNLIAMCTHGHSGVKRWVLGSVTETVVRHSGDPVLVTRAT